MARLQTTGQISITNINSLKGLGTAQSSLEGRDKQYMGNANPAAPKTSGVCMPNEELNQNPTPTKAFTTTPWTWTNTTGDPGYNSQTWGPHKMSEFYGAYNGIPATTIATAGAGPGGVTGSTPWFQRCFIDLFVSGEAGTGPWSYWVQAGTFNTGWVATAGGAISVGGGTWVEVGTNPVTVYAWVKDSLNCGASQEIVYTGSYP